MSLETTLIRTGNLPDRESSAIEGMVHLALFAGFVAM